MIISLITAFTMANTSRMQARFWAAVLAFILCLQVGDVYGHGARHAGGHTHLHARHHGEAVSNSSTSSAERLLQDALAAAAVANKARLENPKFNKNTATPRGLQRHEAPPLDITANSTGASISRRQDKTDDLLSRPYLVPSEVVEAARIVAEARPPHPSGNHSTVAAEAKLKYALGTNNTNHPTPLKSPEGLLSNWGHPSGEESPRKLAKRASGYWMADLPQRGIAPYAETGYKVISFHKAQV